MTNKIDLTDSFWGKDEFLSDIKALKEFVIRLMSNCKDDTSFSVAEIGEHMWFLMALETHLLIDRKENNHVKTENDEDEK